MSSSLHSVMLALLLGPPLLAPEEQIAHAQVLDHYDDEAVSGNPSFKWLVLP